MPAEQERLAAAGDPAADEDPSADDLSAVLQAHLEAIRLRAQGAASWLEPSSHYARLINRDGFVPVTARFDAEDLAFLGKAREQLLGLAELGLRLAELHQPLDVDRIAGDPASPSQRCRSCMCRWPCPTFRTMSQALDGIEGNPGS